MQNYVCKYSEQHLGIQPDILSLNELLIHKIILNSSAILVSFFVEKKVFLCMPKFPIRKTLIHYNLCYSCCSFMQKKSVSYYKTTYLQHLQNLKKKLMNWQEKSRLSLPLIGFRRIFLVLSLWFIVYLFGLAFCNLLQELGM